MAGCTPEQLVHTASEARTPRERLPDTAMGDGEAPAQRKPPPDAVPGETSTHQSTCRSHYQSPRQSIPPSPLAHAEGTEMLNDIGHPLHLTFPLNGNADKASSLPTQAHPLFTSQLSAPPSLH